MKVSAHTTGFPEMISKIRKTGFKGQNAFAGALYAEALHILADSVPRTPLVTSRLRNSQFATVPRPGKWVEVKAGYGTKYAYRVHEGIVTRWGDMTTQQRKAFWARVRKEGYKRSTQGGPKFLLKALNSTASGRWTRIAATTKRYFERGIGVRKAGNMPKSPRGAAAKGRRAAAKQAEKQAEKV